MDRIEGLHHGETARQTLDMVAIFDEGPFTASIGQGCVHGACGLFCALDNHHVR
jgi:hypothetical protein